MARASVSKLVTSAVVGGIDLALEKMGRTDIRDIFRVAVVAGAGIVNYTGMERELSEAALYASIPLLERTVYDFAKSKLGYSRPIVYASSAGFTPLPANPVVTVTNPATQAVRITSL
jgi:uncharacterized protein YcfJ